MDIVGMLTGLGLDEKVVAIVLIVWGCLAPSLFALVRAQIKAIKNAELRKVAAAAVRAAEQLFSGTGTMANQAKYRYAAAKVQSVAGHALSTDALQTIVESAVHEVKAPLKAAAASLTAAGPVKL